MLAGDADEVVQEGCAGDVTRSHGRLTGAVYRLEGATETELVIKIPKGYRRKVPVCDSKMCIQNKLSHLFLDFCMLAHTVLSLYQPCYCNFKFSWMLVTHSIKHSKQPFGGWGCIRMRSAGNPYGQSRQSN